jgi:hypothetical protein
LGLGTGATSEVSITTNGCKCRRASGEVMLRQRDEAAPLAIASSEAAIMAPRME